jgi:uncharacterized ion transporter superfamily protein YfcC
LIFINQFEKDCEDCIQAVKDDPEQAMTVEECPADKGYVSKKEESKTAKTVKTAGRVVLIVAATVVVIALVVVVVVGSGLKDFKMGR